MSAAARRLAGPVQVALTVVLLSVALYETAWLWQFLDANRSLGVDHAYYVEIAQRWLDTGVWYTDRQLAGPYETQTLVDNLYPPHALYLFLPFVWLPFALWWLIPLTLVVYALWRLRPRLWSWPILALIIAMPKTPTAILYGNSDLWMLAFATAGILWGWPAVLATFKPSLGFVALIGIHRRSWWLVAVVLALATVPQLPLWLLWPTVIENSSATVEYSLAMLPFVAFPVVARLASTTRPPVRIPGVLADRFRAVAP